MSEHNFANSYGSLAIKLAGYLLIGGRKNGKGGQRGDGLRQARRWDPPSPLPNSVKGGPHVIGGHCDDHGGAVSGFGMVG
jgi:hypothetical protein